MSLEDTILLALRGAVRDLPAHAFGLRSSALPTHTHIDACIRAAGRLVAELRPRRAEVFIGSPSAATEEAAGVFVFRDGAADAATQRRNEPVEEGTDAPLLMYLSAGATGGESGLEVLHDAGAAQLARGLAREADLPLLKEVAAARSRKVQLRLGDASVELLARYRAASDAPGGEARALPLLGLLPAARPGPLAITGRAAEELDRLRQPDSKLDGALERLRSLSPPERDSLLQELSACMLQGATQDPIEETLRLGSAIQSLALGRGAQDDLCGLTRELARLLRRGPDEIDRLLEKDADKGEPDDGDDDEEHDKTSTSGRARWDWEVVRDEGAEGLDGKVCVLERAADGEGLPSFCLERGSAKIALRARAEQGIPEALIKTEGVEGYIDRGCAAIVSAKAGSRLEAMKSLRSAGLSLRWHNELRVSDGTRLVSDGALEVASFVQARAALCAAVTGLVRPAAEDEQDADEDELPRLLGLLERHPLIVARQCASECRAYVESYISLLKIAESSGDHQLKAWLTNLDVAYGTEADRVSAARLLPLHPLRLASAAAALELRALPPPFPARLAISYHQPDKLEPEGTPGIYAHVPALTPDAEALAEAARQGLEVAWQLVRPTGLVTALRVGLVDLGSSAAVRVIDELCATADELYEDDSEIEGGVHLEVWRVASRDWKPTEDADASLGALGPLGSSCEAVRRGDGVSLRVVRGVVDADSAAEQPCHLVLRAVPTPYESVASSVSATPHRRVEYYPGPRGNIQLVELRGDPALEAYNGLMQSWGFSLRGGLGPSPSYPSDGPPDALVDVRVARGGWPVDPSAAASLLSYSTDRDHFIGILADEEVTSRRLHDRLRELSPSRSVDVAALRRAMLAVFSERGFLAGLLDTDAPDRTLIGKLGPLLAFGEIMSTERPMLPLNLDSSEGRTFIRLLAAGGSQSRADMLILEAADAGAAEAPTQVSRLRVVELKSRTAPPSDLHWEALAAQALQTYARVRECFRTAPAVAGALSAPAAALRHLAYMEAGRQNLARAWAPALESFSAQLDRGEPPDLQVECWVILHSPWGGDVELERECTPLTSTGERDEGGAPVRVRFRVLAPPQASQEPSDARPARNRKPAAPSRAAKLSPTVPEPSAAGAPDEPQHPRPPAQRQGEPAAPGGGQPTSAPATPQPLADNEMRPLERAAAPALHEAGHSPTSTASAAVARAPVQPGEGMRLELGRTIRGGSPVVWLPNRTDVVNHFNVGITGTMGTGKTQLTKSLLAQLVWQGHANPGGRGPGVLVFDYKGDYQDSAAEPFASRIGAKVLPPENLPLNPLKTVRPTSRQEFTMIARTFADTMMAIQPRIGPVQRQELVQAVTRCFEEAGLSPSDPTSWQRPFPTLRDLQLYLAENELAVGTPQSVLMDMVDMGIFAETDPEGEMDAFFDAVHVVDLKPLGSMPTLIRAILCFFMNAFYDRMLRNGEALLVQPPGADHHLRALRRLVFVDEADDFISLGLHSLKNVMQQGRSFGCGVVLSTQFLHHFNRGNDPLRPLIGTWLLHQMSDLNPTDVRALFGVQKAQGDQYVTKLSSLPKHTSLCTGLMAEGTSFRPGAVLDLRDLPFKDLQPPSG